MAIRISLDGRAMPPPGEGRRQTRITGEEGAADPGRILRDQLSMLGIRSSKLW